MLKRAKYTILGGVIGLVGTYYFYGMYERRKKEKGVFFDSTEFKEKVTGGIVGGAAGFMAGYCATPKLMAFITGDKEVSENVKRAVTAGGIGGATTLVAYFAGPFAKKYLSGERSVGELEKKIEKATA